MTDKPLWSMALSRSSGCAAILGPATLTQVLSQLPEPPCKQLSSQQLHSAEAGKRTDRNRLDSFSCGTDQQACVLQLELRWDRQASGGLPTAARGAATAESAGSLLLEAD